MAAALCPRDVCRLKRSCRQRDMLAAAYSEGDDYLTVTV
jgi:hypothetical protein